ncbi:response regulator [Alkalibacillus almallahensis]|uniref:response regulator n=1 Tax=Alkalibacillus almallahensis TaxID=1379154 RepID=UPI00142279EA|nr:response regulator [Alkalibacillus almallahensis]NIK12245.1 two-component SAPR family response regulator [Alkalibacillus almallahensis]
MRTVLIDDEPLALDYLNKQLSRLEAYCVVSQFKNPDEAIQWVETNQVEVVFLDIEMPGFNGIEVAEQLLEKDSRLEIVFVTAYDRYAIKAFDLNALDYLLKPFTLSRLKDTTDRLIKHFQLTDNQHKDQKSHLFIQLFKEPAIYENDFYVSIKWRTSKAQQLFYYLIHNRQRTVSKDELIELLWPEFEMDKALTQLYATIYQVRKTLRRFAGNIEVQSLGTGYKVMLYNVKVDVDICEDFMNEEHPLTEQTINDYELIMSYLKGDYFEGYDYLWTYDEQLRFKFLWIINKTKMIEWYRAQNYMDKAVEHALDIQQRYPLEEEGYYELMRTFAFTGDSQQVENYYCKLVTILKDELDIVPSVKITSWYNNWVNQLSEKN